jgi:hypothetical protein
MADPAGFVGRHLSATSLSVGAALTTALFLLVAGLRWWWCPLLGLGLLAVVDRLSNSGRILDPYPWARGLDGELQVAQMLEGLEDDGYRVEEHIDIGFGDVDLVVVGPTGVFAIEVKNWSGTVRQVNGQFLRNGWDEDRSLRQAIRGAIAIRERLGVAWVEAILVIPNGTVLDAPINIKTVVVVDRDHLLPAITGKAPRLTPRQVDQIHASLQGLSAEEGAEEG